jgi:tRNA(Ile)-lysidine synthase
MFAEAERVLVAVSGGADSIALLHILAALRRDGLFEAELLCGHINHQLRGPASDADERFTVEQADALGLPVVIRIVDVRSHAQTHGLSLETAGRQLRLANLARIACEQGCGWIATGHQKNDNAETLIHRLRRGTGFRGLAGIRPVRERDGLRLASPLLCVTREEIVCYLGERGLTWREDHTNIDVAHTRNFIRHRLLPLLQQQSHASLVEELSDLAASAGELYDRIRREADQAWAAMVQGDDTVRVDASGLAALPELVAVELIRRGLVSLGCGERDLTERHYRSILELARQHTVGKVASLPSGFAARRERSSLAVYRTHSPPAHGESTLAIPGTTRFAGYEIETQVLRRDEIDLGNIAGDKDPFSEYLDWDRVRPPVVARPRQAGDRFVPLGLEAAKKVGKFLTAARVSRQLREQTIIFADREQILWVCPVRIAEPVKVTDATRQVLALTVRGT